MNFTAKVSSNETDWAQKYRPQSLEQMILPAAIKSRLIALRDQEAGLSLLFRGSAGTGKTTAALLLSNRDSNFYINCSLNRGIEMVRELDRPEMYTPMIFGGKRCFVLDESDYLTADAQASLRGVIEALSNTSMFVFTANYAEKLIEPLHSRLQPIDFDFDGNLTLINDMIERSMQVLAQENVQAERSHVANVVRENFPDMRRVLKRLQYQFGLKAA